MEGREEKYECEIYCSVIPSLKKNCFARFFRVSFLFLGQSLNWHSFKGVGLRGREEESKFKTSDVLAQQSSALRESVMCSDYSCISSVK